ncbi:MAG: hypothetical protein QXW39_09905 [Candidatus Bathyarchaeia archaeon]
MSLRGDFGVHLVAYELMRRGWEVALNQGIIMKAMNREIQGYDILAKKKGRTKRIEVKFIDSFLKRGSYRKQLRQRVTPEERKQCDAIIVVVYGSTNHKIYGSTNHKIYIIPKSKFKEVFYSKNTIAIYNGEKESKDKMSKFMVKEGSDWDKILLRSSR